MSASNYTELILLDSVFGSSHVAGFGATVYVALYTSAPSDTGGGTEVTGGSYARVAVTNNNTNWPAAASGAKSNGTRIEFPEATADWGTVTHWAIMSASTAGTQYWWGAYTIPRAVLTGDAPFFPVGGLEITAD